MTEHNKGSRTARPGALELIVGIFARSCLVVAGLMLLAIVAINGYNVFSRYVMRSALPWAEEAMVFLMIAGVFIGSISVTWDRANICIEALVQALPSPMRRPVEWLAVIVASSVLWPVAWLSWGVIQKLRVFEQTSDALHMPVWIPQITMPIALGLMPVMMALSLWRRDRVPPAIPELAGTED